MQTILVVIALGDRCVSIALPLPPTCIGANAKDANPKATVAKCGRLVGSDSIAVYFPPILARSRVGHRHDMRDGGGRPVMIHVLAIIAARPGQRETVLQAFRENVPTVRAEQGCIEYGAAVDVEGLGEIQAEFGPDTFVVIEKWASVDALKAHAVTPHMKAFGAKTRPMIASRTIHVLSPT
jgi:quinol monooxygenase YgiN